MTILLAVKAPVFGIMGADQLGTHPTLPPMRRRKLHVHPRLPIAVATAGLATILTPGYPRREVFFDDVLTEELHAYEPSLSWGAAEVATRLMNRVQPLASPLIEGHARGGRTSFLKFWVMAVVPSGAELAAIVGTTSVGSPSLEAGGLRISAPTEAGSAIRRGNFDHLFGLGANALDFVAEVRSSIEAAIAQERIEKDERDRTIGGPIDIALVDRDGARLVRG